MAIPQANEQKQQLRRDMRQRLKLSDPNSGAVLQKVRDWLENQPGLKCIAIYSPLPGEIDPTPLVAEMPEIVWAFPRVEGAELVLHQVTDIDKDLEPGAFGIREPRIDLPVISPFGIDAFFCPGLAFDESGGRLGRGRGFYDRMLKTASGTALKIGVCTACQMVPDTFAEPHDIFMDRVISA